MKLAQIGNAERAAWPTTDGNGHLTVGTISLETAGAGGAPALYASATETDTALIKLATTNGYLMVPHAAPSRITREIIWVYLDITKTNTSASKVLWQTYSWTGGTAQKRVVIRSYNSGSPNQYNLRMMGYQENGSSNIGASNTYFSYPLGGMAAFLWATPGWYKFDIQTTLESAAGAADGSMNIYIYNASDTLYAQAEATSLTTFTGLLTESQWMCNTNDATYEYEFYLHDWTITNAIATDTPGLLGATIHSASRVNKTCRIRCVCDRACTGVLTYGTLGTENTAVAVTLSDSDSARILEYSLTGLVADTDYKWRITLTDSADGTNTQLWSSYEGGATEFQFMPCPSATAEVVPMTISDNHLRFRNVDGEASQYFMERGCHGRPNFLLALGDSFEASQTLVRAATRMLANKFWAQCRLPCACMPGIYLQGNHESDGDAAFTTYIQAILPIVQTVQTVQYGSVDFITFPEEIAATEAAGLALVAGGLTDAVEASSASHVAILTHAPVHEHSAAAVASTGSLQYSDVRDAIEALMAAHTGAIYSISGHIHNGNLWIDPTYSNVWHLISPPFQSVGNKNVWASVANDAGYPGSLAATISGYGAETGCAGWLYLVFAEYYARVQVFDSQWATLAFTAELELDKYRLVT